MQQELSEGLQAAIVQAYPVLEHGDTLGTEIAALAALPPIDEDEVTNPLNEHLDVLPSQSLMDLTMGSIAIEEPTSAQKAALHKAHINLGHPRQQEFLRALRLAGISLSLRLWVRDFFKCPACESMRIGGLRRPAILPRTFAFNVSLAIWLFRGTSVSTEDAKAALASWVAHFGVPHAVQSDDGPEFRGPFSEAVEHLGAIHVKTDTYAPHQNGLAERQLLMAEVIASRNAFVDRSGHSSSQRVFGANPRRPMLGILQEDHLNFDASALEEQDPRQEYARTRALRQHALSALIQQDVHTRVQRAMIARNRQSEVLKIGDWVYILRSNRLGRKWREGPAIITMLAGATTWVSLRGHLYKVATINVRKATEEECKSVQTVNELLPELQTVAMEQKGRRRFTDVTREPAWEDANNEESTVVPSRELSRRPSTSLASEPLPTGVAHEVVANMPSSSSQGAVSLPPTPRQPDVAMEPTETRITADPAQEAHTASVNLRTVRRGRSPSAPRRVRGRVSGPIVQEHVDRIESTIAQQSSQLPSAETQPFMDVEYVYSWSDEKALWTEQRSEIFFSDPDNDVPFERLEGFAKAMEKEAKSMMVDNQALVPPSLEESQHIRNHKPELILPSRWHFKRKIVETPDGIVKNPKARWILLGHRDRAAVELGESSYAPSLLTINIVLQALASSQRCAGTADFSAAFLQANHTSREVYVSQPPEGSMEAQPDLVDGETPWCPTSRNLVINSQSTTHVFSFFDLKGHNKQARKRLQLQSRS
eukprot:292219-Amphidinium_carterae.2